MSKWARILNNVIDAVSLDQPMQRSIDKDGNITVLPERGWIEAPDEVFAGFSYNTERDEYYPPLPEPTPIPDRVTARQFKLQLLAAGLFDQVEGWVATQSQAVRIAYQNSDTFVRDEPMMQQGFAALGYTPEQIDAFFTAADKL